MVLVLVLVTACSTEESTSDIKLEPSKYEIVNNLDDVLMTVKENANLTSGLLLILENKSDKEYMYGEEFFLEKKLDEK